MRHTELSEGISVLDDKGNVVGTSKLAARHVSMENLHVLRERLLANDRAEFCSDKCLFVQALMETSLTRVVLPMPVLLLPPFVMAILERSEKILWIWYFRLQSYFLQHHHLGNSHTHMNHMSWYIFISQVDVNTFVYVFKGAHTQFKMAHKKQKLFGCQAQNMIYKSSLTVVHTICFWSHTITKIFPFTIALKYTLYTFQKM